MSVFQPLVLRNWNTLKVNALGFYFEICVVEYLSVLVY